jgi:AcrR family transcriptional regulator|tara:strand:+ start:1092 stop:1811 length:720 start_codon:yes stop_codon:yes gene_type:complete
MAMNWGIAAKPSIPAYFPREKENRKVREFKRREEEILETALQLFRVHGEDKVTVEIIADNVGIGKGTIYKHFKSKSDIYISLLINYEHQLASLLATKDFSDPESLWRSYFEFRMSDPEQALLFDRLEDRLVKGEEYEKEISDVHQVRNENMQVLTILVEKRIDSGKLENVPAYFHLSASWALVHGALALHDSAFFKEFIQDREAFFEFLMQIGMRMGNHGQSRHADVSKKVANEKPTSK